MKHPDHRLVSVETDLIFTASVLWTAAHDGRVKENWCFVVERVLAGPGCGFREPASATDAAAPRPHQPLQCLATELPSHSSIINRGRECLSSVASVLQLSQQLQLDCTVINHRSISVRTCLAMILNYENVTLCNSVRNSTISVHRFADGVWVSEQC